MPYAMLPLDRQTTLLTSGHVITLFSAAAAFYAMRYAGIHRIVGIRPHGIQAAQKQRFSYYCPLLRHCFYAIASASLDEADRVRCLLRLIFRRLYLFLPPCR